VAALVAAAAGATAIAKRRASEPALVDLTEAPVE
jgi:hypothetical protein